MTKLESIALNNCVAYRRWSDARDGAILQLRKKPGETFEIVLKCKIPNANDVLTPCVVVLEGTDLCSWKTIGHDVSALDVSNYFRLYVENPAPSCYGQTDSAGQVIAHDNGAMFVVVRSVDIKGYLCVKPEGVYGYGKIYYDINPANIFDVGRLNLKPIDTA